MLATESDRPNTIPAPRLHPHHSAVAPPSAVATAICTMAPGTAMRRTDIRSAMEKCSPTPNIMSITPSSASWLVSSTSATNPGVAGPMTMPATRYPTSGGSPARVASRPVSSASPRPAAMVVIRVTSWGIVGPPSARG